MIAEALAIAVENSSTYYICCTNTRCLESRGRLGRSGEDRPTSDFATFPLFFSTLTYRSRVMLAADPAIVEREREARHRAEIAALVSRLVPRPKPATDLLISLALPQPSEQWDTIKVGHSERNIDFWDERALAEAYKKVDQRERLELSRDQVDQVKAIRKALSTASKGIAAELESPALAGQYPLA